MGKTIMVDNILSVLKGYKKQWDIVDSRNFNEQELAALAETAKCVASNYGRSYCFTMPSTGKNVFIPCDSLDSVDIGESVPTKDIDIIQLKYLGEDPNILKNLKPDRTTLRAKYTERLEKDVEATDFNNPLGI